MPESRHNECEILLVWAVQISVDVVVSRGVEARRLLSQRFKHLIYTVSCVFIGLSSVFLRSFLLRRGFHRLTIANQSSNLSKCLSQEVLWVNTISLLSSRAHDLNRAQISLLQVDLRTFDGDAHDLRNLDVEHHVSHELCASLDTLLVLFLAGFHDVGATAREL